jgi:hypothetical protein
MTNTLPAQSDAEFLGMIPELAGFTATNSLVCIAMNGLEGYVPFRLDLPAGKRVADARPFASKVIGILSGMRSIDRVAIVIYTDESFAAHRGVPRLGFIRAIAERVHQQGFHFAGLFCVAADGWAECYDDEAPKKGRPLSEIPLPAVALPRAEEVETPEATVAEREAFLELLVDVCSGHWPRALKHIDTRDPWTVIELCATWEEGELPDALLVSLAELTQSTAHCPAIAVTFGFGLPGDDHELFHGRGRTAPDVARLERGIHLFSRIVALAPRHYAPNALCLLAWMRWALGFSPAASYLVDRVFERAPGHELAEHVEDVIDERPDWLRA